MTVVIGTAGHIDHGKTTLLRALTGIDADRLPEERARGMTIDVGYAHLVLADGTAIDFVDVPGHDRLVGNMLVGAGEIDAALLVVAADDGPRAQTREHLELLDGLAIDDGVVAITKTDTVDAARVADVVAEVRALVRATSLGDVPVLPVSATAGDGLEALGAALVALRDRVAARRGADGGWATGTRFAIDRVFTIRGRGTVVTGTLRGAPIARGDVLRVVPVGPGGATVRVREVQVHGRTVDRADADGRVALNVAGEGAAGLERGAVLTSQPAVLASDRWLVALRPVADLPGAQGSAGRPGAAGARGSAGDRRRMLPADRMPVTVHAGTAHVAAVLGRSGRDLVDLGNGETTAILRLDRPLAVRAGDRFVLRRPSPVETLAGGRVVDPEPPRGVARRRATPDRIAALASAVAGSELWQAARLELHGAIAGAHPGVAPDVAAAIDAAILAIVAARPAVGSAEVVRAGAAELRRRAGGSGAVAGPRPGSRPSSRAGSGAGSGSDLSTRAADARVDELVAAGRLTRDGDRIAAPGAIAAGPSPALAAALDRLVAALSAPNPPSLAAAAREAGCPPEGIGLLEQANRIVRLDDDLAWASPTWRGLAARALELAGEGALTPAAFRDATGTSRKYVMAILEDLDRRAILRRTPAGHLVGPRAARFVAELTASGASDGAVDRPAVGVAMTGPSVVAVSGIVLAGGRSARFGSDKLAARVGPTTLLDRSIAALAAVVDEVVIVLAPGDARVPAQAARPMRLVADAEAYAGPLVGLLTGLEAVDQPVTIVVGGDMPDLRPEVLRLLIGTLLADASISAVVLRSRGALVPLPAAVRTGAATDIARRLVGDGERRLRSLFERLPILILEEGEWRPLDPDGDTIRDVDRPADLPST